MLFLSLCRTVCRCFASRPAIFLRAILRFISDAKPVNWSVNVYRSNASTRGVEGDVLSEAVALDANPNSRINGRHRASWLTAPVPSVGACGFMDDINCTFAPTRNQQASCHSWLRAYLQPFDPEPRFALQRERGCGRGDAGALDLAVAS